MMLRETAGTFLTRQDSSSHSTSKPRPGLLGRHPKSPVPVDLAVLGAGQKLEQRFPDPIWIAGELVEVREARRGRWFGTLRGRESRVEVHVPPNVARQAPAPEAGAAVLVQGTLRIWDRGGEFRIEAVSPPVATHSEGSRAAVRKAAERTLRAEGVFDAPKRPVPSWPRSVAVVSSPRGAAIGDIRSVIRRRAPWVSVNLYDCVVQGPAAPSAIVNALVTAGQSNADLVILTRGGGATDRLDAFDDPVVVRQVARSRLPIIVAVGHERDHTLADLAADVSAPTPSAAAERAVPDREDLSKHLKALGKRIDAAADQRLTRTRVDVERSEHRVARAMRERLTRAQSELRETATRSEEQTRRLLTALRASLVRRDPGSPRSRIGRLITQQLTRADELRSRIDRAMQHHTSVQRARLEASRVPGLFDRLKEGAASDRYRALRLWRSVRALSPSELLSRGYAMVIGPGATTVKGVRDLQSQTELELVFEDGTAAVVVLEVEHRTESREDR